jgi:hypothetical protein
MENKEIKHCPLILMSHGSTYSECIKNQCAWWDEEKQCCAILHLSSLRQHLGW